jgi:dihydroflavonol-4-reductase
MKVFLTGGTGFIGQSLTKRLVARGWEVIALVRNSETNAALTVRGLGAQLVDGDVTELKSMRAGMTGVDIVIHSAAHYEYGIAGTARQRMYEVNVTGTEHVLALALELKIPRTVYVSSTVAYGDSGPEQRDERFERQKPPRTWYEKTKTEAHEIGLSYRARGLPLIIVSPAGVVGPNDHSVLGYMLRLYVQGLFPPMLSGARSIFPFVDVDDVAEGIALAAEKGRVSENYFLTGEPLPFKEHLRFWAMGPGGMQVKVWLPPALMAFSTLPLEPLQRRAGLPAFLSRESVATGASNMNYLSAKAQRELGWSHLSAQEMWRKAIDGELELLARRTKRDLLSRLRPVPA